MDWEKPTILARCQCPMHDRPSPVNKFEPLATMNYGMAESTLQSTSFTMGKASNQGKHARSPSCGQVKTTGKDGNKVGN